MNNKISKVVFLSLIALLLAGSNAFAAFELNSYAQMWMTSSNTSTVSKDIFKLNEQPWLYIRFFGDTTRIGESSTNTKWIWDGGTSADKSFVQFYLGSNNDIWIGFDETYWKEKMQLAGDWTVKATALFTDSSGSQPGGVLKSFGGTTNFKVNAVPEPVSALLFLTGGAAIAAFRRKRA